MHKLDEPTPYEILGIDPNADKPSITKAFMEKDRSSGKEYVQIRAAYDKLRKYEERILVDAFIPFLDSENSETINLIKLIPDHQVPIDWTEVLDTKFDFQEIFEKFIHEVIVSFFTKLPTPTISSDLISDFDDLEGSIQSWKKD